ncbi:hypothetical protein EJ04DRAFT_573279 [Polyplosphaeria fusca]|uniref:U three protein 23 n=1 Tax=Polyplosphaeria fusca TaxID=682080 RepID=A0A9P4RA93_9PLEO|nr:hypothetical protein EJ04DRAFT_573279 [Polyplosphaeria fusca]
MRGKRHKASKRLMQRFIQTFGFREPYQVLVDAQILQDAKRFKIDLLGRIQKLLQAEIKPLITQCSMRHLYSAIPKDEDLITQAKEYERRRCGHHELDEPLTSFECICECVDPKGHNTNKFRYVVASQDRKLRAHLRQIPGVPLIYIHKSVVILEPMAAESQNFRETEEKAKFKAGIKGARNANAGQKRKREDEDSADEAVTGNVEHSPSDSRLQKTKKKQKGPKGPNPLSAKKSKKNAPPSATATPKLSRDRPPEAETSIGEDAESGKRKRRRKHKPKGDGGADTKTEEDQTVS